VSPSTADPDAGAGQPPLEPDPPLASRLDPPTARRVPSTRSFHGDDVVDDYEWLRAKDDPETIAYLEAENAYTENQTLHLEPLQRAIFEEISARTQQTDTSVPTRQGSWWYFRRTHEGQQYPAHCRCPAVGADVTPPTVTPGSERLDGEELLLDGNIEAGDSEFFSVGGLDVSPDDRFLAYSTDTTGDERYTLRFVNLSDHERLPDEVHDISGSMAWSRSASHVFYTTVDDAWRPFKVWRHELGTPVADDVCVLHEPDERYWLNLELSRDEQWIVVSAGSKITSEVSLLSADDPTGELRVVAPRRVGVEYSVEPAGDRLLVLHNLDAEDFELATAPLTASSMDDWTPVVAHTPGRRLTDVLAFETHVVLGSRFDGLAGVSVLTRSADGRLSPPVDVEFDEPISTTYVGDTPDYRSPVVRLQYTSMVTPASVYDHVLATGELILRKQQPVLGGYDPSRYEQHREWAVADDGTKIPISLVCAAGTERNGENPFLLYGYGSYEASIDPYFSIARLSLLDRGFVFAIAHVRGGGEMGRQWYEQGKMLAKRNTFTDFVACARRVVDAGWTSPPRLAIRGASAGGLLMGAVANLAPDAFAAVQAGVPFVDALTSILDPDLPLTVVEWDEWGDPLHDPEVYAYMKSYSPYENIAPRPYPAILATTSLNDTRVLYVEPAKWVAKLRQIATGGRNILLQTEMTAGHGGRSGRYDAWRQEAFELAWIIDQVAPTVPGDPTGDASVA
jgi:oligopeptidase B